VSLSESAADESVSQLNVCAECATAVPYVKSLAVGTWFALEVNAIVDSVERLVRSEAFAATK